MKTTREVAELLKVAKSTVQNYKKINPNLKEGKHYKLEPLPNGTDQVMWTKKGVQKLIDAPMNKNQTIFIHHYNYVFTDGGYSSIIRIVSSTLSINELQRRLDDEHIFAPKVYKVKPIQGLTTRTAKVFLRDELSAYFIDKPRGLWFQCTLKQFKKSTGVKIK